MRITLRFFPSFLINIAASYFMLAAVSSNYLKTNLLGQFFQLIYNLFFAILYYILALIVDSNLIMDSNSFFQLNSSVQIVGGLFAIIILLFLIYSKIGDRKKSKV